MATFIATVKFTQQGIAGIHETVQRATALKSVAKKMGARITNMFWTLGPFDGVLIFEAPDDETATALMLHIGSLGNVHTQTARAFNAAELEKVFAKMSK